MSEPVKFDHILPLVKKPGRYIGGELNASVKNWEEAEVRFVLVFPDLYEIGMSHFGLQILYHLLNARENTLAERCYSPDIDMERELRRHGIPLFSIESRRTLGSFDVIGITLPYELCYTNILTLLDLAGIPLRSEQRDTSFPLVIGGGSCGLNPEPMADFFDAIVLGDGEEVILEIAEVVRAAKKTKAPRQEILTSLSAIDGIYIPSFFASQYAGSELIGIQPLKPGYTSVRRHVLPELPGPETLGRPLVPIVKPVHDRLGVEIARGCTRGCRFCQAGIIYRPVRERSIKDIMAIAEQGIESSGFDELALLSLSTGDFSCLGDLMIQLMDRFADQYVSVSMPSMRVGTLTSEVMNQIKRVRKTGFTVAPEAGTDRLREVINKGITEEDLLETCRNAFAMGWNLIKFYFMIGLPTETWEDVEAIVDLTKKARQEAGHAAKRVKINVSVGIFVPKPHTPFQWDRQLTLNESKERINHLKKLLPRGGFKLKWHDPYQSIMEGVFSRGDRRLSGLIETAWRDGVRFDGWSEHYRLENWQRAAEQCGIDLDTYLLARDPEKPLPWDHLNSGVDKDFLVEEHHKALEKVYTPDCRTHGCQKCGLCDFEKVRPVVNPEPDKDQRFGPVRKGDHEEKVNREHDQAYTYRVHYSRLGDSRFYSHLEVLQLIFRALSRTGLPVLYSQGFNPTPRVSFSPALPVGVESEVEYFDVKLTSPLKNIQEIVNRLSSELPEGMEVFSLVLAGKSEPGALLIAYEVGLPDLLTSEQLDHINRFLAQESCIIERVRKKKKKELDIRPLVKNISAEGCQLHFELVSIPSKAGVSPREILQHAAVLEDEDVLLARIKKISVVEFSAST